MLSRNHAMEAPESEPSETSVAVAWNATTSPTWNRTSEAGEVMRTVGTRPGPELSVQAHTTTNATVTAAQRPASADKERFILPLTKEGSIRLLCRILPIPEWNGVF